MPFENEIATGESLIALEKSAALCGLKSTIKLRTDAAIRDTAPLAIVPQSDWFPRRVIAIDGSSITQRVQNGFPGAECRLVMLSVVFIDSSKLARIEPTRSHPSASSTR